MFMRISFQLLGRENTALNVASVGEVAYGAGDDFDVVMTLDVVRVTEAAVAVAWAVDAAHWRNHRDARAGAKYQSRPSRPATMPSTAPRHVSAALWFSMPRAAVIIDVIKMTPRAIPKRPPCISLT